MSANMVLCFWGVPTEMVNEQLALNSTPKPGFPSEDVLNVWYNSCRELGPIEGQHSFAALVELNEQYPKKPTWQHCEPTIILCEGNEQDTHMVLALGQQSNFKATKFLKPGPGDLVRALHISYMHHVDYLKGAEVPLETVRALKERWAHYNGVPLTGIGTYWNLARHTGSIWELISDILEGRVKKAKGRDFKIPKSLHHFNGMGNMPDTVLKQMLTRVVDGAWTTKELYEQCGRYKVVMGLRAMILEFVVEHKAMEEGSTWAQLVAKMPRITDPFVDTWVPTMAAMTKKQRSMPEALKSILKTMIHENSVEQRAKVHLLFI